MHCEKLSCGDLNEGGHCVMFEEDPIFVVAVVGDSGAVAVVVFAAVVVVGCFGDVDDNQIVFLLLVVNCCLSHCCHKSNFVFEE